MQEHVIELFKMSFLPDSEKLKYVTTQMEELAKQPGTVLCYLGFCPMMMLIADTPVVDELVVLALYLVRV